jgi:hypothetical protein
MFAEYSKLIAVVVGFALSYAVVKFGLPAEWATGDFATWVTSIITAVLVWRFPANATPAE